MSERNAKELVLDGIVGLGGGVYAFGILALPPSLTGMQALGRFASAVLFLGCLGSLIGYVWPDRDDGMSIQQGAQPFIFAGSIFYAAALIAASTGAGNSGMAFAYAFAVAVGALGRWVQLRSQIRRRTLEDVRLNGERDGV